MTINDSVRNARNIIIIPVIMTYAGCATTYDVSGKIVWRGTDRPIHAKMQITALKPKKNADIIETGRDGEYSFSLESGKYLRRFKDADRPWLGVLSADTLNVQGNRHERIEITDTYMRRKAR
jgi:hypothetical protein